MTIHPSSRPRLPRLLAETFGLATLYLATAQLSFLFSIPPVQVTLLWLPAGLSLASLLLFGRRALPGVLLGAFVIGVAQISFTSTAWPVALLGCVLIAFGSTLQALAAAYLMRRWVLRSPAEFTPASILKFIGLSGLACLIAPTVGTSYSFLNAYSPPGTYALTWIIWWLGDWCGVVVGMPFFAAAGARLLRTRNIEATGLLIASLGIGASLGLFAASWTLETQAVTARFGADAQSHKLALQRTMDTSLHNLDALESLFIASQHVTRAEFRAFTLKYLASEHTVRGLQALSWDPYIPAGERAAYEAAAQREGFAGFQFTERDATGALIRAADRPDYVVVSYIEPLEDNRAALGYDVSSNPIRQKALAVARDTGREAMTEPITLIQETGKQKGFLIFRPIYRQGVLLDSITARRANLLGFAVAVIRIGDIVEASLAPLAEAGDDIYLFDASAPAGEQLLYHRSPVANELAGGADLAIDSASLRHGIYYQSEIAIAGRRWLMVTRPTPDSIAAARSSDPWAVLLAGLCFTTLAVAYQFSRQWAEARLRENEQATRLILDTARDAVITINTCGYITNWNDQAERIFGWRKDEALGQRLSETIIPPEFHTAHERGIKHYLATHEGPLLGQRVEVVAVRRSGERFPIELSIQSVTTKGVTTFTAFAGDISERKRAEAILQEAEARYRTLIENAHDLIQSIGQDGRIEFANPAWHATFGYSASERQALTVWDILDPASLTACQAEFARVMSGETVHIAEATFVAKDGRKVYVTGTAAPRIVDGVVVATQTFFRNITAHKHEETLRAGRFAVAQLLAESPSLAEATPKLLLLMAEHLDWALAELWLRNADGALHWETGWHAAAPELAEFTAASQVWQLDANNSLIERVFRDGQPIWIEDTSAETGCTRSEIAKRSGLRALVALPIRDQTAVNGAIVLFSRAERACDQDMLDLLVELGQQIGQFIARKQVEAALEAERASLERRVVDRTVELSQANTQLAKAARLKDEFLSNMSHELRTPLNAILAFSESLLEQLRGPLNNHQQSAIHNIETSGRHLLALINDILDLSKIEAGQMRLQLESILIADVCQASLTFVRQMSLKKQIKLDFRQNDPHATVYADARRLKQILVNLLSNAVKFTNPGGQVSLEVAIDSQTGDVQFHVRDTGIGIAPEGLAQLFQPFTQLDSSLSRQYEGTGLGLALVQRLAELHGGTIAIESQIGKGSQFTVVLPNAHSLPANTELSPAELALTPLASAISQPAEAHNLVSPAAPTATAARILLAEDNEANILALSTYLRAKGYDLMIARDGHEALALANETRPDLILMDVQMPKLDGLAATRQLRATPEFFTTPIIALTALAMPGDAQRCLSAGASEYITKPVLLKDLLKTIRRLLPQ